MIGLFRSELLKVVTTRLWWGLLLGLVAASVALSVLIGAVTGLSTTAGAPAPSLDDPAVVRSVYTAGLQVSYLFALAFGVIAMSGEYRHQTITATVLASPRRGRVVIAKVVAVARVGLGYGVVSVLAGVAGGIPVILIRGGTLHLESDGIPRALVLAVVAIALWAVLGLGIGTLLRNQVVALLVSVGVAWIVEPVTALLLNTAGIGAVARFLPGQATTAVTSPASSSGGLTVQLLPWWGGVLVLLAYAAVSGSLGATLTLRRDLT
jgi:ABC-type transport system involved in multi-copper enzyme maturation permease subunit